MSRRRPALNQILGQNIRVYRAAKSLSQEDLAEKAGIKRAQVGFIERGEIDPRLATVGKIAAGLEIDAFKLLVPVSEQLAASIKIENKKRRQPSKR